MDDIAQSIVIEQGKTFGDAKGDVLRGLQVVETMCGLPSLLLADKLEVARDMDTEIRKVPLGVGAAICPFNFPGTDPLPDCLVLPTSSLANNEYFDPAMIPLWSMVAIAAGPSSFPRRPPLESAVTCVGYRQLFDRQALGA
jgi:malonate-semialdehyde dehydrogenase (acetylating) / methylmalonate-semialdehyde dehydrogenase